MILDVLLLSISRKIKYISKAKDLFLYFSFGTSKSSIVFICFFPSKKVQYKFDDSFDGIAADDTRFDIVDFLQSNQSGNE